MTDDLERRLRAARPSTASTDANAFDAELLARVREQPIARRRTIPRAVAVPAAAGVTLSATAVVMLGGGPGDVGGPSSASAITQILRWLNPPPGTILHVRSVETMGGHTTTRELWQSADDPESERQRIEGARSFESSGDAFYDPATDTIYDPRAESTTGKPPATTDSACSDATTTAKRAMIPTAPRQPVIAQAGRLPARRRRIAPPRNTASAAPVSTKVATSTKVVTRWSA